MKIGVMESSLRDFASLAWWIVNNFKNDKGSPALKGLFLIFWKLKLIMKIKW